MFRLADSWVWDLWFADDGENYHMFFLHAPRDLPSPADRHFLARIGHATSADLWAWERAPDALGPGNAPAFDDLATWTGSVVRGPDGMWHLFYTGASKAEDGLVQRIGLATSPDLFVWEPLVRSSSPIPAGTRLLTRPCGPTRPAEIPGCSASRLVGTCCSPPAPITALLTTGA